MWISCLSKPKQWKKSEQICYLWNGDKGRFWGACWPIRSRLRGRWGSWDRDIFVLHVVYPITEGLDGISCGDRDIKSFVFDCHPSKKPASRQTALSQILGLLPNLWQPREQERAERDWGKEGVKRAQRASLSASSVSLRVVRQTNQRQQSQVWLWNLSWGRMFQKSDKTPKPLCVSYFKLCLVLNARHVYFFNLSSNYPSIRNPAETQWTHLSNTNKPGSCPRLITKILLSNNSRSQIAKSWPNSAIMSALEMMNANLFAGSSALRKGIF